MDGYETAEEGGSEVLGSVLMRLKYLIIVSWIID
jgi:hypothetical protein